MRLQVMEEEEPFTRLLQPTCYVKAAEISEYLASKKAAKRKGVRADTHKGPPTKQSRTDGGLITSLPHTRAAEDRIDFITFEIAVHKFMAKAIEYSQEVSKISTSLGLAAQRALSEKIASKVLTSCTRSTMPMDSEMPGTSASTCPHQWSVQK